MDEYEFYDKVIAELKKQTKILRDLNDWCNYFHEKTQESESKRRLLG